MFSVMSVSISISQSVLRASRCNHTWTCLNLSILPSPDFFLLGEPLPRLKHMECIHSPTHMETPPALPPTQTCSNLFTFEALTPPSRPVRAPPPPPAEVGGWLSTERTSCRCLHFESHKIYHHSSEHFQIV